MEWLSWFASPENTKPLALVVLFVTFVLIVFFVYGDKKRSDRLRATRTCHSWMMNLKARKTRNESGKTQSKRYKLLVTLGMAIFKNITIRFRSGGNTRFISALQ
jgi:hypothetical protein